MKYFLVIFLCACGVKVTDARPIAEGNASAFAQNLGGKVRSVSCVSRDTDLDGYVSCTVFREDREPLGIQCSYYAGEGCKLDEAKVVPARVTE